MYYAGNDGVFKRDGAFDIDGYKYYLDVMGRLQKGWCGDNQEYYGDLEDGFLINGFQELEVPRDWATENEKEKTAWFYFDTSTCKRVYSENDPYISKMIGNRRYCFERTGWRLIRETEPAMKGWMYFVEETTDEFKFGEAVTDTWYSVEPPTEILPSMEVRFFYFNGQGQPRTAPVGKYQKVRLGDKTYLFNEYGYAVYGIRKVDNEYYYFGNSDADCSMRVGKYTLQDSLGNRYHYYFKDSGEGYTGVHQNKLYYKGLLQTAGEYTKYEAIKVDGIVRLVNESGTIMKNKKMVKDASGVVWSTNSSGIVTYTDEGVVNEPTFPLVNED